MLGMTDRREMILVCGNESITASYPWECSETSCENTFSTTLGMDLWMDYGLML